MTNPADGHQFSSWLGDEAERRPASRTLGELQRWLAEATRSSALAVEAFALGEAVAAAVRLR